MKHLKWIVPVLFLFFFTGCYNYRELNQLAITSAVGVNKTEDGQFELFIQVMNTQKNGSDSNSSGDQPKFITYKTKGRTIQEAFRNVVLESPRRLYVNHISLLLISEDVAKEGLHDVLDLFARDTEFRKQFYVLISKNSDTEDILTTLTPLEALNAKNIKDSVDADHLYLGSIVPTTLEEMLGIYLNDYREMALPSIELIGDQKKGENQENLEDSMPSTHVVLGPMAIFKGDEMVGYLSKNQGIAYSFLMDEIKNSILIHKCDDGSPASIEVVSSSATMSPKKNQPVIEIKIKSQGNINEINCDLDLKKPEVIKKLQTNIGNELQKSVEELIEYIIETYHSDVFGFEELIYKNNPNYYRRLKEQYQDTLLSHIEVKVNVELKLLTKGNLLKVIP